MQYYTFELTNGAKELCVIITPFRKYKYEQVPMDIKQSPDFAQEVIEDIFWEMQDVEGYIDDIGIWGHSWEHHQRIMDKVLQQLEQNGFTVNSFIGAVLYYRDMYHLTALTYSLAVC
jgi:hypothetical protein